MDRAKLRLNLKCLTKSLAPSLVLLLVPTLAHAAVPVRSPNATPKANVGQHPIYIVQDTISNGNFSNLELQVLAEMNRVRTNPGAYADELESLKQYYSGYSLQLPNQSPLRTQEGIQAVDEAIRVLRSLRPLPSLQLSVGMSLGAKDHTNDIGSKGIIGHYGSDGSQFLDRISRYGSSNGAVGENISYGATTAQAIVMQLIVDDGVAGRFHRDNIVYDGFNITGIACGPHQRYEQICTIIYSSEYRDRIAINSPPTLPPPNPTRITTSSVIPAFPEALPSPLPSEIAIEIPPVPPASSVIQVPPAPPPNAEDLAIPLPPAATTTLPVSPSTEAAPPVETTTPPVSPSVEAEKRVLQEEGTLADGDLVYARDGSLYDVYTFQGRISQAISISVESSDFDTFLAVFDENDQIIGQNDDIDANNTNSLLKITLPRDGTYRIFINGYDARDRGRYTVEVVE